MRLVVFSDLHLDAPFAWLGATGAAARRRRQGLRETLQRVVALASEVEADAILCAGDLYEHDRASPDTAAFLRQAFAEIHPVPVFVAPGNHDWHGPRSLYSQTAWSPNVCVFTGKSLSPVTLADGLTLWGGAHLAPSGTSGFIDSFTVDRGGLHLALFHGSEQSWYSQQEQGKALHAPFTADQIERAGLSYAFVGHYHQPRDAARHTYAGNPEPLNFGEEGVRGAVVATVEPNGHVRVERRRVAMTEAHDLVVDISGCASQQDVRGRLVELLNGLQGVARATLSGVLDENVDLQPADFNDAAPWLDGLTVRLGALQASYPIDQIAREATVRGEFVRAVLQDRDLPADERRRVLVTGLRALDDRDDLEVA